jgi:hypothetical protein
MRYVKTEWGIKVKIFTQRYGITLKQLAAACDVKYSTLLQMLVGKCPGIDITPKVDAFMTEYVEKTDLASRRAITPIKEAEL